MKREELKQHSGKHVIIVLNGKEELSAAELHVNDRYVAYLTVTPPEGWLKSTHYPLTDTDVESLSLIGRGGGDLIGDIHLKRDGASLKRDDSAQPRLEK
jgi:hypothetical protein